MLSPVMATVESHTKAIEKMSSEAEAEHDPSGGLLKYYEKVKTGNEEYTVKDVYYRAENNHLQGLYYDKDYKSFYESAGLYGQSHV